MEKPEFKLLPALQIPMPCHEEWGAIEGGERARFCSRCSTDVSDLAHYSASEAEEMLAEGGNLSVRLTEDPAKGIPMKDGWILRAAVADLAAALLAGCQATNGDASSPARTTMEVQPSREGNHQAYVGWVKLKK